MMFSKTRSCEHKKRTISGPLSSCHVPRAALNSSLRRDRITKHFIDGVKSGCRKDQEAAGRAKFAALQRQAELRRQVVPQPCERPLFTAFALHSLQTEAEKASPKLFSREKSGPHCSTKHTLFACARVRARVCVRVQRVVAV